MATTTVCYWKQLWKWTTSNTLSNEDLAVVLDKKEVIEALREGLASYKPGKKEDFSRLQAKHTDQTALLNVVNTLQNYMDVDCFQIWEILKHYLCDISYGTTANALKNTAFVDTRPSYLLPNVWNFYYAERLFLLKLLQYILQHQDDKTHRYQKLFHKIICDLKLDSLRESLISQFEEALLTAPPLRRINNEFSCDRVRQDWAEFKLREQVAILQNILLLANEKTFPDKDFVKLYKLFEKHNFGKNLGYNELLEEDHMQLCSRIMYLETCIFIVVVANVHKCQIATWIDKTKDVVEPGLTQLQINPEHSPMLMSWMLLTLRSEQHAKLFETQYHHFGATALKSHLFEFMHSMLSNPVFSDQSMCAALAKRHIFRFLNELCDRFDGDGTVSNQPGIMQLCSLLLETEEIASEFWCLMQKDEEGGCGVVSLWNTALEYFPLNFSALSVLAAGLARGGLSSVRNLTAELKNLPVFTELYSINAVPIMALNTEEAIIGRDHFPLGCQSYRVEAGSKATIMERKDSTTIHYRTPYSYWTVLNKDIEQALDRKGHHQHDVKVTIERVYEGTKVLKSILKALVVQKEVPKMLVEPSEGVFEVMVRFMRAETPPLPLLVECLEMCTALIPLFPKEIHMRLSNTGLLPRILNRQLSAPQYARGEALDSAAVGAYLITLEQPRGSYSFLRAYIEMLCTFHELSDDDRITSDIILPGVVLILREVFPSVSEWRYSNAAERRSLLHLCSRFINLLLQRTKDDVAKKTCVYSLLYTENALELLKIISVGNNQLERTMHGETNWTNGECTQHVTTIQRCVAIVMLALRLKTTVTGPGDVTPLEHLVFSQNTHKGALKVVPRVASYINHAFNKSLPVLCCRLLKKFSEGFQMSLFASLEMTAYQVRVMFLDRLRDKYETTELKIAILEFVSKSVGNQPGLTEAFFNICHDKMDTDNGDKVKPVTVKKSDEDISFEGVLGYMADYLGTVKADPKLLHSPLLSCIMGLFHALWKNNMQILVRKLRENPKFWEHMTSPLFSEIQPGLNTYSQIFNVVGIELFTSRTNLEPSFVEMLEKFFNTDNKHLDTWVDYIFSFKGRCCCEEIVDKVPVWLSLLTSWKDFTTIFCKFLPISLNIAHKAKLVAPCMAALLNELEDLQDGRIVVILAELYIIMLANWKDDCFENRKASAKQIDSLLTNTAVVYECLHPRAVSAILSIGTVAVSTLDYEIKANSAIAQSIIRSVTNINSLELEKLYDEIKQETAPKPKESGSEEIPPVVLSLAMLEQCLELYDGMLTSLPQWFQSTRFVNKLLCCLQICLQNRRYYHTSLAALRCLTSYARGPFASDLLMSDVDQFLWLQLLPPKFDRDGGSWKGEEWWRVYGYSLDFIAVMVMKHGQLFAGPAVTFVGVHVEHLAEAVALPQQAPGAAARELCAAALSLVVQLVRFEARWRIENINSLLGIMRSISQCLYHCVSLMLRSRRSADPAPDAQQAPNILHRVPEILHMATLCLHSFSPPLLALLADPAPAAARWPPLVELHFGAPKLAREPAAQLTLGALLAAVCVLARSLNHSYHAEESSGARSPRARRRACSCSPGERRAAPEPGSASAAASAGPLLTHRLVAAALEAAATLAASQALLAVRDPSLPPRHKQLIRRELASEVALFHDFVRKRILCGAHPRSHLERNHLGAWPLPPNEQELRRLYECRKETSVIDEHDTSLPPPPPPKRASHDSMREYILRKHYLDKCAQTPTKEPSPVSHSTPAPDKKKEASRISKRVSFSDTTCSSEENPLDYSLEPIEPAYSNLTDVQINNDEDYFHFMSVVFHHICQN